MNYHFEMTPVILLVQKKKNQTQRKRETWKSCIYKSKDIITNDPQFLHERRYDIVDKTLSLESASSEVLGPVLPLTSYMTLGNLPTLCLNFLIFKKIF